MYSTRRGICIPLGARSGSLMMTYPASSPSPGAWIRAKTNRIYSAQAAEGMCPFVIGVGHDAGLVRRPRPVPSALGGENIRVVFDCSRPLRCRCAGSVSGCHSLFAFRVVALVDSWTGRVWLFPRCPAKRKCVANKNVRVRLLFPDQNLRVYKGVCIHPCVKKSLFLIPIKDHVTHTNNVIYREDC